MRPYAMGGFALLLFFGLSPGPVAAQTADPKPAAAPQAVAEPTMHCFDCHDQAKAFGNNAHSRGKAAKTGEVPNTVCESCHGDGTAHMDGGGDTTKIYKPVGREGANKVCLTCHDTNTDRWARHSGMHANSPSVNCFSCHSIHGSDPKVAKLLVKPQLALCNTCHAVQVASFRSKPYAHRLGRGGMECTSCHEPHGRPARQSLRGTAAGELPCLGCHADKRGPFVFQHGAAAIGDCTNCHEVHGSVNPKQLRRANVAQLCVECHSPINPNPLTPISDNTLGSQPPSFHNYYFARYQNCTTCHVAVHGSNRDPRLLK